MVTGLFKFFRVSWKKIPQTLAFLSGKSEDISLYSPENGIPLGLIDSDCAKAFPATFRRLNRRPKMKKVAHVGYERTAEAMTPREVIAAFGRCPIRSLFVVFGLIMKVRGFNDKVPNLVVVRIGSGETVIVSFAGEKRWKIDVLFESEEEVLPLGCRVFYRHV